MDLGFKCLIDICPSTQKREFPETDYLELRDELNKSHAEFCKLQQSLDVALRSQAWLSHNKINSGIYSYLCDTIGFEEFVEMPAGCINNATANVCTEICLEGLGTFISNLCKKIIEFFKKLYETIMNFFGIRTYRHRQTENKLYDIQEKIDAMSDSEFRAQCSKDIKCSVPTANIKELSKACVDLKAFFNDLNASKDIDKLDALVSRIGGSLTKLGHKVQNEYKLVKDSGLPYREFNANVTLNIQTDLNITDKGGPKALIHEVTELLDTVLDIQRWYPANLKKYAARATEFQKQNVKDSEDATLQAESIKQLNEEQKCQALLCASICLYTSCIEYVCARTIATLGSIVR